MSSLVSSAPDSGSPDSDDRHHAVADDTRHIVIQLFLPAVRASRPRPCSEAIRTSRSAASESGCPVKVFDRIKPRPIERMRIIFFMSSGRLISPSMPEAWASRNPKVTFSSSIKIATLRTESMSDSRRTSESSSCGSAVVCESVLPKS